ncbi:MAG: hypothetical protein ACRC0S_00110 [Fusobacteriaceae bacterium]
MTLIVSVVSYSFQMDRVDFDEVIEKGKTKSKEYTIHNNSKDIKQYEISIEGKYPNIKVSPSKFVIKPDADKEITVKIKGEGKKGENSYYLVFTERNLTQQRDNKVIVNKKIRIKQKYII